MFKKLYHLEDQILINKTIQKPLQYLRCYIKEDACYFECFLNDKKYIGHFAEVHVQPEDQVRIIYTVNKDKRKIIALYNLSQHILHLPLYTAIFSRWSYKHKVIPNILKIFVILNLILLFIFSATDLQQEPFNLFTVFTDSIKFTLGGILLFLIFVCPYFILYFYIQRYRTMKIIKLLQMTPIQIASIEQHYNIYQIYHF